MEFNTGPILFRTGPFFYGGCMPTYLNQTTETIVLDEGSVGPGEKISLVRETVTSGLTRVSTQPYVAISPQAYELQFSATETQHVTNLWGENILEFEAVSCDFILRAGSAENPETFSLAEGTSFSVNNPRIINNIFASSTGAGTLKITVTPKSWIDQ